MLTQKDPSNLPQIDQKSTVGAENSQNEAKNCSIIDTQMKNYDRSVPVHTKICDLYFDKDECISEASFEQSLISSAQKSKCNDSDLHQNEEFNISMSGYSSQNGGDVETPSKYYEAEMSLDLSRISNHNSAQK